MSTISDYQDYATQVANQYNIPPQAFLSLLNSESGFNQNAISSQGAIGIGQLMPSTAQSLGVNPNNAYSNITGAAKYYKQMLNDNNNDIAMAMVNYVNGSNSGATLSSISPNLKSAINNAGSGGNGFWNSALTNVGNAVSASVTTHSFSFLSEIEQVGWNAVILFIAVLLLIFGIAHLS